MTNHTELMPVSETLDAAKSILPYMGELANDPHKTDYLAYRFTGFSVREAAKLAGVHQRTVQRWRKFDVVFRHWEDKTSSPERAQLRREILHLHFVKNMVRVFNKDTQVLEKALGNIKGPDGEPLKLSQFEQAYLNKMRGSYNASELATLEKLLTPNSGESFNLEKFLARMFSTDSDGNTTGREVALVFSKQTETEPR